MSQEDREMYLLHDEGVDGWLRPQPAREAIVDAVTGATDLTADDVGNLEDYVDESTLRELLDGDEDGPISFEVEGQEITVDSTGNVTIA